MGLHFDFFLAVSQFWAFVFVVITGYYHGGFGAGLQWREKGRGNVGNINYHGMMMSFGFVFLQGEALLAFRLYRHETKIFSKFLHLLTHALAISVISVGLAAIVNHKNINNNAHMYTFHAWVGVALVACYGSQYIIGFVSFIFPKTSPSARRAIMPFHRYFGASIFGVACAQVLGGQMEWYRIKAGLPFAPYNIVNTTQCLTTLTCPRREFLNLNFAMIALILYAVSVLYLVLRSDYQREKTPEEME